ncbi:MAG: helix-turn-helix domain-containing protein [Mogibacterium sp.]|nr:helix-turn-helix domain-containing protein [Mogibacterium sp.]
MHFIASNIRYLRKRDGYSQQALANLLGYHSDKSFTTVQKWESGVSTPPLVVFLRLAEIFKVDLDTLAYQNMADPSSRIEYNKSSSIVPVYRSLSNDDSADKYQDIEGFVDIDSKDLDADKSYFALRVTDASMHPKYEKDDIVLFEKQDAYSTGSDCVVRIGDNDATFMKVRNNRDHILLQPINPDFEPVLISNDGSFSIKILGVAREIRRKV